MSTDSGTRIDKLIGDQERIAFLGEQDGPIERSLKEQLMNAFRRVEAVDSAYLARIQYSDEASWAVALCLRCCLRDKVEDAVRSAADIFHKMFSKTERLDIIDVADEQWPQLRAVCKPFYVKEKKA